jgi:uracil-DNA glycosylase
VHETGIPWDDPSGDRLHNWFGLTPEQFHDLRKVAIVPMGFCYPGETASGDNLMIMSGLSSTSFFSA